jgi:hypothetical protein
MDEYGNSFYSDFETDTLRKPLVAVFPHPAHGRLVERVILMVSHMINFKGQKYVLSWRDSDVCFYAPMS